MPSFLCKCLHMSCSSWISFYVRELWGGGPSKKPSQKKSYRMRKWSYGFRPHGARTTETVAAFMWRKMKNSSFISHVFDYKLRRSLLVTGTSTFQRWSFFLCFWVNWTVTLANFNFGPLNANIPGLFFFPRIVIGFPVWSKTDLLEFHWGGSETGLRESLIAATHASIFTIFTSEEKQRGKTVGISAAPFCEFKAFSLFGILQDRLYWTDVEDEAIYSANRLTGHDVAKVAEHLNNPLDLVVFHEQRQPKGESRSLCR